MSCESLLSEIKGRLATPVSELTNRIADHLSVLRNRGTEKDTYAVIQLTLCFVDEQYRTDLETLVAMVECARDALKILGRYHSGDGSISREQAIDALGSITELDRLASVEAK